MWLSLLANHCLDEVYKKIFRKFNNYNTPCHGGMFQELV